MKIIIILLISLNFISFSNNLHFNNDKFFGFNSQNAISSYSNEIYFTYLSEYKIEEREREIHDIRIMKSEFKNLKLKFENAKFENFSGIENNDYNVFNFNKVENKKFINNDKIVIENIYNNINLEIKNNDLNYEYIIELKENADLNDVEISCDTPIENIEGNIALGDFIMTKAIAFYKHNPTQFIDIKYKIINNKIKFEITNYDKSKVVIIDPIVMLKSTYYGGIAIDRFYDMDLDSNQNSYAAGLTLSTAQIAFNGYQNIKDADYDAYMVKFDSTGKRIWGTYFGGEFNDIAFSNKVKGDNILMAGRMSSETFTMTTDAHQKVFGGDDDDGFWAEFNNDGEVLYSTYYGGEKNDAINGIGYENGAVYITGYTRSIDRIVSGGYQTVLGGAYDMFLVRFEDGIRDWGTYLGGEFSDFGNNILVENNRIFVVGSTNSSNNIAKNGYNNSLTGKYDGFFSEFLINGDLVRSSYFGGSDDDFMNAVDYDGTNLYILGTSYSNNLPVNTHQTTFGGSSDAFVAKFETNSLIKSTYYGGSLGESFYDIKYDEDLFIVGASRSDNNIGINSDFMDRSGNHDAVLAKFDKNLNVIFGAYLGGQEEDVARSVFNHDRKIYVAGYTSSANIFGLNGHQNNYNGDTDAFYSIFKDNSYRNISINNNVEYCSESDIQLDIEPDYEISNENFFTVYLSDENGNFTNKKQIYNQKGNFNKLNINLPEINIYSDKYRFQVESSKPYNLSVSEEFIIYPKLNYSIIRDTICPNESINLFSKEYPSSETKWYLNKELIYEGDSLNYTISESGKYKLNIIQSNDNCISEDSITVLVKNVKTLELIGNTDVCLNKVEKYYFKTNSKEEINWKVLGGVISSQKDDSIFVEWNSILASISASIEATKNDCEISQKLIINPVKLNVAEIIGGDSSCIECTEEYYIKNEYDSYNWTVEGGEVLSNSSTLSNIIVKWKSKPGKINVTYKKGGCEDIAEKDIYFLSEPKLQISPSVSQVCLDDEIKFVTSDAEFLSFTWTVENAEIVEDNDNNIIVKFNKVGLVDIKLIRFNNMNQKSEEISKLINVNNISNIDIQELKTEYCLNENITIINNNAEHKIEILSVDYELIKTEENKIIIKYNSIGDKELKINVADLITNCNEEILFNYTINDVPEAATIKEENGKIISDKIRNKWYENDILLSEEGNIITPKNNMTYYAIAVNEFDCLSEENSNTITFNMSSVRNNNLLIYPNPSNNYLEIKLNHNYSNIKLEIINLLGEKELINNYYNTNNIKLNHNLKTGIYLLLLYSNDELINKNKIIINN